MMTRVKKRIQLKMALTHMRLPIGINTLKTQTHQPQSSPPLQPVPPMCLPYTYAVVDKNKKKVIREAEDGPTEANSDECAMPMEMHSQIVDTGERVVACDGLEEEQYDDTVVFRNEPEVTLSAK